MRNPKAVAILALIVWCVMSAFSRAYISDVLQETNPFVFCFYAFLFTMVFYMIPVAIKRGGLLKKVSANFRGVMILNLTTFGCWFFVVYPLKYIAPSLMSSAVLAIETVWVVFLQPFVLKKSHQGKLTAFFGIAFAVIAIYILAISSPHFSVMKHITTGTYVVSVIFILLASLTLAGTTLMSSKLYRLDFNISELLAVRFVLLAVVSFYAAMLATKANIGISEVLLWHILLVTFLYTIIPLYLVQFAIKHGGPVSVSFFSPIMPLLIFVFNTVFFNAAVFHEKVVVALMLLFVFAVWSSYYNYRKN